MSSATTLREARFALRLHPGSGHCPVSAVAVTGQLVEGGLSLRYELLGDQGSIALPTAATPLRSPELWKHTCMECFLAGDGPGYREFNFSPSLAWAAFAFSDYRAGVRDLEAPVPPAISSRGNAIQYTLEARLSAGLIEAWQASTARRLALSAVIEDRRGQLHYWALRHPQAQPDFHHADGFVLWQA